MPKIKDLGINAIPLTMQPPAVGNGGGDAYTGTKEPKCGSHDKPSTKEPGCDAFTGTKGPQCLKEDLPHTKQPGCDAQTGTKGCTHDDPEYTGTKGPKCGPPKNASAFTPEAVAQLRQQIVNQSAGM